MLHLDHTIYLLLPVCSQMNTHAELLLDEVVHLPIVIPAKPDSWLGSCQPQTTPFPIPLGWGSADPRGRRDGRFTHHGGKGLGECPVVWTTSVCLSASLQAPVPLD